MTKRNSLIIAFTFYCLLLISCSGDSPKPVAKKFLQAYSKMDFATAKKFGTEETSKILDMLEGYSRMMPDAAKTKKEIKFEINSSKTTGDSATVTYLIEGNHKEQTLFLIRINGEW